MHLSSCPGRLPRPGRPLIHESCNKWTRALVRAYFANNASVCRSFGWTHVANALSALSIPQRPQHPLASSASSASQASFSVLSVLSIPAPLSIFSVYSEAPHQKGNDSCNKNMKFQMNQHIESIS